MTANAEDADIEYNRDVSSPDSEQPMVLKLPPQLETVLTEQARQRGVAPETLAVDVLRRHLLPTAPPVPADEWERQLFAAAVDCGVSVSDAALSSDGLYD